MTKERRLHALENQIGRLQARLIDLERLSNRYGWARLAVFVTGFVATGAAFFLDIRWLVWLLLVVSIAAFSAAVAVHRRVERSIDRHRIWLRLKQSQVARMQHDWGQLPPTGLQPSNSFELDLDLVGEFSLHRLVNTAVSGGGSQRLRAWLSPPLSEPQVILQRQQTVRELVPRALFRGRLALNAIQAAPKGEVLDGDKLLAWLSEHSASAALKRWLAILGSLAALNLLLLFLNLAGLIPPLWLATLVLYAALFLFGSRAIGEPFGEASHLRDALEQQVAVFEYLETYSYKDAPNLEALCKPFLNRQQRPSQYLRRINRIVAATGVRGNPLIGLVLNIIGPWDFYFAWRLSQLKGELAGHLPEWLEVWYELEALGSLANLVYLNPHFTLPTLLPADEPERGPVFKAVGLGHPLIPDAQKICNDFSIGALGEIDLFTGSNMSGKSTFLKTVGINLALAFAGGPVDAQGLETTLFRLHTCIRISDSVVDGISYFYAEVRCLKSLLAALQAQDRHPLFYFIDEIFRGTNNRERLIGSRAYIRALASREGIGLISTHDLELVQLAGEIPNLKNYHFRDDVSDGRMVFDYTVNPGPSPTTNALRIMRMEGLPI